MEKPLISEHTVGAKTAVVDTSPRKSTAVTGTTPSSPGRHRSSSSFSGTKASIFFFGLVLTACISIYKAASQSGTEGAGEVDISQGGRQQQLATADTEKFQFAPLRLEADNGSAKSQSDATEKEPVGESKGKSTAEAARETESNGKTNTRQNKPLNIVILYADDWRHDDIGVASPNNVVHTPFLDWLANTQGIRFTHNCVTTSVCWISRATLHTGQYYSRHKATRPIDNEWYQGWGNSFPEVLKKLGYYVGHIGKWHSKDFGDISGTYDFKRMYFGRHWFPGAYEIISGCRLLCVLASDKNRLNLLTFQPELRGNHAKKL